MHFIYRSTLVLFLVGCGSNPGNSGPVPFEELPTRYADVACSIYDECDFVYALPYSGAQCTEYFGSLYENSFLVPIAAAIERGTIVYDANAAGECFAAYDELGCDLAAILTTPQFAQTCAMMYRGQVADGDQCTIDQECAQTSYCAGAACPGTCMPRTPGGAACTDPTSCEVGYYCLDGTCRTLGSDSGDGCMDGEIFACPLDEACIGATATTPGECTPVSELRTQAAGETCNQAPTEGQLCQQGLSCAYVASPGTYECRAPVAANGPCFSATPSMCPSTQRCDANPFGGMYEGVCVDLAGEGGACTGQLDCVVGLVCSANTCVAMHDIGEPCTGSNECYSYRCDAGVCAAQESCAM